MPNFIELLALLRDFTEIHCPSFRSIIQAKAATLGGAENFLTTEPKVCLILLKYRKPDPCRPANPALNFTYSSCTFLPLQRVISDASEYRERIKESLEKSAGTREAYRVAHADDRDFVDLLPVMYSPQLGPVQLVHYPVNRTFGSSLRRDPTPTTVKLDLQFALKMIELGVVMRERRGRSKPGYMKNLGKKRSLEMRVQILQHRLAEVGQQPAT
ncbi:hypothetical protein L227DRAFT_167293 [Lentinus tigrinus ALCF2SS1-6]|uniref:Uncharacterized protein n=1 Tax=Lentinus tigrinus ALCF2SS1-6 TaxID=1328759 RepID=A0A5C2SD25_9APHY|nr:hypothetical protein L227DRAFT_167293 [Lentinus tigrinus ALCF2SS1-6]